MYNVLVKVIRQSSEINNASVKGNGEIGANDQGITFGYACDETDEMILMSICNAHKLARQLSKLGKQVILII